MDRPSHDPDRGFRSLTTRLIVWTLLAVGAVYVVTVVVSNTLARRMALAAAEREAINEADGAVGQVQDVLHAVEERTLVLAAVVDDAESSGGRARPSAGRLRPGSSGGVRRGHRLRAR